MKNIDIRNLELLFTYHDIYPEAPDFRLEEEIGRVNANSAISVICELIQSLNYKVDIANSPFCFPYETALKKEFCGIEPKSLDDFLNCESLHKNKHIISQQMLLILLKYVLAYSQSNNGELTEIKQDTYKHIINLCLMVTENCNQYIQTPEFDVQNFIYCNYHVNNSKNIAASFSRTYYMLEVLNPQKELFEEVSKEYINYNEDYINHYGFSILETISVLFWETRAYLGTDSQRLQYTSICKSANESYGNAPILRTAEKVLGMLSGSVSDGKSWACDTLDQIWNFSWFLSHPFLMMETGEYISVSEYSLKNAFFENVFWLIRACYSEDKKSAMAFYGRLFELYIQRLSKNAAKNTVYEYIDEFLFGRDNKRSSDAYIKCGRRLLIIEAKGFSILISSLLDEDIEKNNNKLFANPILEANECLYNIRNSNDNRFDEVEEAFIVSVTMDNINAVPGYLYNIEEKIKIERKETGITEHYYNMSIDEYEMLMRMLENGMDIFSTLVEYSTLSEIPPFSNYLREINGEPIGMTEFMKEIYEEASEKMKELYGIEN